MKKYMPLEGLRWSRDSGSALCDTSQNSRSRTGWGGGILFSVTSLIEKTILLNLEKSPAREHYLSTTFLAFCLFMFVVSSKGIKPNLLSKIGERDSLYIYVFHPLLLMSLSPIIKTMPYIIGQCYNVTAPLVVLFVTIVFIVTLRKIKIIK